MYEVRTTFIQEGEPREIFDYFFSYELALKYALHYYEKSNCSNSLVYKDGSLAFDARAFIDNTYEEMMEEENNG